MRSRTRSPQRAQSWGTRHGRLVLEDGVVGVLRTAPAGMKDSSTTGLSPVSRNRSYTSSSPEKSNVPSSRTLTVSGRKVPCARTRPHPDLVAHDPQGLGVLGGDVRARRPRAGPRRAGRSARRRSSAARRPGAGPAPRSCPRTRPPAPAPVPPEGERRIPCRTAPQRLRRSTWPRGRSRSSPGSTSVSAYGGCGTASTSPPRWSSGSNGPVRAVGARCTRYPSAPSTGCQSSRTSPAPASATSPSGGGSSAIPVSRSSPACPGSSLRCPMRCSQSSRALSLGHEGPLACKRFL